MDQQEMVAETARAASVAAAAAAATAIPPMTWGDATPAAFLAHWARVIAVQDPHGKEEDPPRVPHQETLPNVRNN
jgi:hypothetical protein